MTVKSIAAFADLHVGHPAGLMLRSYELPSGNVIKANRAQLKLYEYWEEFKHEARNCDYVLNLGDTVDGVNRKEFGADILMTDLNVQVSVASEILKDFVGDRPYLSVTGSPYHGSLDTSIEHQIAATLPNGKCYGLVLWWKVKGTGKTIFAAHDLGMTMYKGTALDRARLYSDALSDQLGKADLILGAHGHKYFEICTGATRAAYLPCWKIWSPIRAYGAKGYFIHYPKIGGAIIHVGKRITIDPITFPPIRLFDQTNEV